MTWYEFLFQTGDHHFQWVGISAIVTAISVLVVVITFSINAKYDRQKFERQLIASRELDLSKLRSASRIEWMNIVREIIARTGSDAVIAYHERAMFLKYSLGYKGTKRGEAYDRSTDANREFLKASQELILYIPRSDGNKALLDAIGKLNRTYNQNLNTLLANKQQLKEKFTKDDGNVNWIEFDKFLGKEERKLSAARLELMKVAQSYFKDEWEKAKRGE